MVVFSDFHHEDLYYSLWLLFERRCEWDLLRPIGIEWYTEDYWMLHDSMGTAQQYLSLDSGQALKEKQDAQPNGGHELLNAGATKYEPCNGLYYVPDRARPGVEYMALTLEAAKTHHIDVFVSSTPEHWVRFEKFRKQYHPKAKHIFQMGNNWTPAHDVQNLLNSTTSRPEHVPHQINYHQEFDLKVFHPGPCNNPKSVSNFMHYNGDHYRKEFMQLKAMMPDWEFNEYGAGNANGPVPPGTMASYLRGTGFVWHCKRGGDGYGYNLHQALACGRPVIFKGSEVKGQTAAKLLQHGVTGIDLDQCTLEEAVKGLRQSVVDEECIRRQCKGRFDHYVDFNAEFKQISEWLWRLL